MNGVHDMGGLQCFGDISPDPNEVLFHDHWERQVLALALAMGATGSWNIDQSRQARETLPPATYLGAGYYRIWLYALEKLLLERQLVTAEELAEGKSMRTAPRLSRRLQAENVPAALAAGSPVNRATKYSAKFQPGDTVVVVNQHSPTHTRLPAYVRGHRGIVTAVHGCHVFPDSNARGEGENPQWLYNVAFAAIELWGTTRTQLDTVRVDCWEPYLEAV